MIRDITLAGKLCKCDKCGHSWISVGESTPTYCRNSKCRSREWNGKKQRSHVQEIKLPAPRKGGKPKRNAMTGEDV